MGFAYFVADDIGEAAIDAYHESRRAWREEAYALALRLTGCAAASVSESFGETRLSGLAVLDGSKSYPGLRVGKGSDIVEGVGRVWLASPHRGTKEGKAIDREIEALNDRAPRRPFGLFGLSGGGYISERGGMSWPSFGRYGDVRVVAVPAKDSGAPFDVPRHARQIETWEWEYLKAHGALPAATVTA